MHAGARTGQLRVTQSRGRLAAPLSAYATSAHRHESAPDSGRVGRACAPPGRPIVPLSGMDRTTGYADVNGLHMYYEVTGAGPPLLAMAGGTQSLEMFSDDIELLSRSFTVLAPEQM